MTFVTRLTLRSGDRAALDDAVGDIKAAARRKGVQFKGPHAHPPRTLQVPLYKTVEAADSFGDWEYTVYTRELEIVGHEGFASDVAQGGFPPGIHASVEVERVGQPG